jgi:excisionase family DNA binding protein
MSPQPGKLRHAAGRQSPPPTSPQFRSLSRASDRLHLPDQEPGDAAVEPSAPLLPLIERIFSELEGIRELLSGRRKDLYTTAEVAEATGRSEYTVRRWIAEGLVEAIRVEGTGPRGRLLVPRVSS